MTYRNYLAATLALASTFVLLAVCSIPTYAVVRDDALAARWKLGEDATIGGVTGVEVISVPDATGNLENTLTQLIDVEHDPNTNDPQRVPGFNPGGFATHFDGGWNGSDWSSGGDALITQTADPNINAALDFADGPFSISFWTKVSQDNDQFVKFFATRDPSNDQLFYESEILFEGPNFINGFGIRTAGGEGGIGADFGEEFDFDAWHLLTFVRDRPGEENTIAMFHNGEEIGREFDGSDLVSIPGPFGIGGENGAGLPNQDINATIDEFRLYNIALTPEEVAAIYNDGEGDVAASSELLFLWGNRGLTGSWGVSGGWQSQDPPALPMDTADIPMSGQEFSDPVQVLMGTVSVDTGDQGAWSLQIDAGAGLNVASGRSLFVVKDVTADPNSSITLAGTLTASTIDAQGTVTFANGVLAVGGGTIAAAATSSDATIQNSEELSVGQMTLGNGDALVKQSGGTLILDQSGGANSFAAGSSINVEAGAVAGVNDAANNALGSAAVNMDGGNLVLSSSQAGAAAFDVAVAVNSDAVILAAQIGTGALADETVTLGGTNGVSLATDVVATLETADGYTLNLAGDVAGDGQLSFASGAQVNVTGAVTAKVVQFSGDTSGVTGIGNVAPGEAYLFAPTEGTPEMSVGFAISGVSDVIVEGQVDGSVSLDGGSSYTGATIIRRGTFRTGGTVPGDFDDNGKVDGADFLLWQINPSVGDLADWEANYGSSGGGLPAGSLLQFEGATPGDLAVLESADATFERNIGTGAGEVTWAGSGGFASKGGAGGLAVTLEGGAALSFSSATEGFNGHALQLGSPTADGKVELINPLNLENAEGVVQIDDNPDSDQDFAEISGIVSSTAGGDDVLTVTAENGAETFQNGLLVLSGANTMSKLRIKDASVDAAPGVGLPAGANLEFAGNDGNRPAVWVGSGTANQNIGSGAGEVSWAGPGGFGARGGDLTVTLEGGATLAWEDPNNGFNGADLQLGSNHSDARTTFTNSVTGSNDPNEPAPRVIKTFGNQFSGSDEIYLEGDFVTGFGEWIVEGFNSQVVLNGDVTVSATNPDNNEEVGFFAAIGSVTMQVNGDVSVGRDAAFIDSAKVFVNTQVFDVGGGLFVEGGDASLGGNGKISVGSPPFSGLVLIAPGTFLRPGPDFDAVGTLEIVLEEPGNGADFEPSRLLMLTESTFEMEFINDGGLQHDSVNVDGVLPGPEFAQIMLGEGEEDVWNLELEALNDVSGLVTAGAEYDLFTWNEFIDLVINGVNITAMGADMTGDVTNVAVNSTDFTGGTVHYEIAAGFASGRVYVTGLTPAALAVSAAVPEPASWAMVAVAVVGMVARRRRKQM